MKCPILVWNCRDVTKSSLERTIKSYVKIHRIKVMALVETRISGIRADRVINRLGLEDLTRSKLKYSWGYLDSLGGYAQGGNNEE